MHQDTSTPRPAAESEWDLFLQEVIREFHCTTGTLHRLDPADRHLKLVAAQAIPPQLIPVIQSIPVGKGIAGCAAERLEPVELCNLQTDNSGVAKPGARQTNVQGSLAVPVMDGARLCGTLGIGKMEPYEFTPEEKARLLQIAGRAAAKLLPAG
ncbi:MAG: GAF domain-containing protein [Prosthecobacter sp.]|jgi:GAF domain-containing protein|nr:GAF domain-containing protein [Prosthecobacter sp.]